MKGKALSGIMLTLLLTSMLTLALNIQSAKAVNTVYIRADGSVDPPTAPISTVDSITYTFIANIYDSIVVERSNIIIEGHGYTLQGSGSGHGFTNPYYEEDNVTIQNVNIKGFQRGVNLLGFILLTNNITNNSEFGVYGTGQISQNTISNNGEGIGLFSFSSGNIISENVLKNNGIFARFGSGNIIAGNDLNDGSVQLLEGGGNSILRNNISNGGVFISEESYDTVSGNNITNSNTGVSLYRATKCIVSRNNITNNGSGVLVGSEGSNNTISENKITNNGDGICLRGHWCPNNTVSRNIIAGNLRNFGIYYSELLSDFVQSVDESNTVDGKSIYYWINRHDLTVPSDAGYVGLINCLNITVEGLTLRNNGQGILLVNTTISQITSNNITNNDSGIEFWASNDNSVSGNNIARNNQGMFFTTVDLSSTSDDNRIYHNNFLNNTMQVRTQGPPSECVNFWDDGYPSGGNYWSDYTGVDEKSGPNQDQPASDGVGDTPCVIDAQNVDNYPLMKPWIGVVTATVDIKPDTLNLKSKSKWVTAHIELSAAYSPSDIDVSSIKLNVVLQAELYPIRIEDYDGDGILDLMVKFKAANLTPLMHVGLNRIIVSGKVNGMLFEGVDTIKVNA